jgi:uncharacterized membrane protein
MTPGMASSSAEGSVGFNKLDRHQEVPNDGWLPMAEAALMNRVESEAAPAPAFMTRVRSVDVVRGLVCVLMAIDHVRVYSGIPAGGPTPGVFLTRWVTHFVAPAFCFFAGTAAFFLGRRLNDTRVLRRFLVSRGLLLVVLELTLIRFLWSFNPNLTQFSLAGVIWMLGWCMVLLGLFIGMKPKTIGWIGVGIVLLQQVFGLPPRAPGMSAIAPVWGFLYPSGAEAPLGFNVLYVIVPWIGVMMAGYGFGLFWDRDESSRDRLFVRLGLGMTAEWIVIATVFAVATVAAVARPAVTDPSRRSDAGAQPAEVPSLAALPADDVRAGDRTPAVGGEVARLGRERARHVRARANDVLSHAPAGHSRVGPRRDGHSHGRVPERVVPDGPVHAGTSRGAVDALAALPGLGDLHRGVVSAVPLVRRPQANQPSALDAIHLRSGRWLHSEVGLGWRGRSRGL